MLPSADGHISLGVKSFGPKGTPGKLSALESKSEPADPGPYRPKPAMWLTTASTMILKRMKKPVAEL